MITYPWLLAQGGFRRPLPSPPASGRVSIAVWTRVRTVVAALRRARCHRGERAHSTARALSLNAHHRAAQSPDGSQRDPLVVNGLRQALMVRLAWRVDRQALSLPDNAAAKDTEYRSVQYVT
jgi:hypothetical protein